MLQELHGLEQFLLEMEKSNFVDQVTRTSLSLLTQNANAIHAKTILGPTYGSLLQEILAVYNFLVFTMYTSY